MKIPIYIKAALILAAYTASSWFVLGVAIALDNVFVALGVALAFGMLVSILFLFIFSHKSVFKFARIIEKRERKMEKKWLKMFSRFGKPAASALIAFVGGPLPGALTVALLMPKAKYRYLFVALINIPSAVFYVGSARGIFSVLF